MHVLDIVGRSGHQPADRVAGKKFKRQILYMRIKLHPHIVHDHVPAVFHNHFLAKIEDEIKKDDGQKDERHFTQSINISVT